MNFKNGMFLIGAILCGCFAYNIGLTASCAGACDSCRCPRGLPGLQGPRGTGNGGSALGNYLFVYKIDEQEATPATTFVPLVFTNTGANDGWTVAASTFTCPATGTYSIICTTTFAPVSGFPSFLFTAALRIVKGVVEIDGSQTQVQFTIYSPIVTATDHVIVDLVQGDTIQAQFAGESDDVDLVRCALGTMVAGGTRMSASMVITRLS